MSHSASVRFIIALSVMTASLWGGCLGFAASKRAMGTSSTSSARVSTPTSKVELVADTVTEIADVQPSFPGGQAALNAYLLKNLTSSEEAKKNWSEGTVTVSFDIAKDGNHSWVSLTPNSTLHDVKEVNTDLAREVARIIGLMPKWIPGTLKGKTERFMVTLPITLGTTGSVLSAAIENHEIEFIKMDTMAFGSTLANDIPNVNPGFPYGQDTLAAFIRNNLVYPAEAKKNRVHGTVIATFFVGKGGSISDIKIKKSINKALDNEAKRIISVMPKWWPGTRNWKPEKMKVTLPIKFANHQFDSTGIRPSMVGKVTVTFDTTVVSVDAGNGWEFHDIHRSCVLTRKVPR